MPKPELYLGTTGDDMGSYFERSDRERDGVASGGRDYQGYEACLNAGPHDGFCEGATPTLERLLRCSIEIEEVSVASMGYGCNIRTYPQTRRNPRSRELSQTLFVVDGQGESSNCSSRNRSLTPSPALVRHTRAIYTLEF
jgi:hypothetical protein